MKRNLPPFPAVRAFEAAARHLSFRRAAEELHVTRSAISHQIKALELFLGQPLFRREKGGVALTNAGRDYLPAIIRALDGIESATEGAQLRDASGRLDLVTTPAFASRWLLPRLGDFRESHPWIDVRLTTSACAVDFDREPVDVAVWPGDGDWPGLSADSVLDAALYPVCSPELLHGARPLTAIPDLRGQTLLHGDEGENWARWLRIAGVDGIDTSRGVRFKDCNLMIQAAVEGQGIALAPSALVTRDVAENRLVCPFDLPLAAPYQYYVLSPEEWADRPKNRAFRDWILTVDRDRQDIAAAE